MKFGNLIDFIFSDHPVFLYKKFTLQNCLEITGRTNFLYFNYRFSYLVNWHIFIKKKNQYFDGCSTIADGITDLRICLLRKDIGNGGELSEYIQF